MRTFGIGLIGLVFLSACGEPEVVLPGKREPLRLDDSAALQAAELPSETSRPIALAAQSRNSNWTQKTGSPGTRAVHPALSDTLSLAWSAPIGQGDKRRYRISADPVIADGRIFTLDSASQVVATSQTGDRLWAADLTPDRDRGGEAANGALAYGDGQLFVTSGYGLVVALDPETGDTLWSQKLQASGTGAPTIFDGLLYLVAGDATAWALEADTGRIRWQIDGSSDVANVLGGPAPAVTDKLAVFAYGTGEVQAAFRQGGLRLWSSIVAGQRRGRAAATVDDITGDPVIDGETVYVGTHSGRLIAANVNSGDRIWTLTEGALGPVWPAGDSVFAVTDLNKLVRVDAATGDVIWSADLPGFVLKRRTRRRAAIFAHYGPVVAGGRVIVASNDGQLRSFDPVDGAVLSVVEIPGGAASAPVVADGTLFVVSSKGALLAFR